MNTLKLINESIKNSYDGNVAEIYKLGEINVIDDKLNVIRINVSDIIDVVDDAMFYMQKKFPYLYLFIKAYKIMYVPVYPSRITDTMMVDDSNNLWINMNFVYNQCGMKIKNVFGLLFHEMFHIFLEHFVRFNKMFPQEDLNILSNDMLRILNTKSNISMDYEINASMVEDNIVPENFWKDMNGFYKKEYTGLTWEEIYKRYGDKEYQEYLEKNGKKLSDGELEIIKAIEDAAKVLSDPSATDKDKAKASRDLQKKLDQIFGKDKENDIQNALEDMKNSPLSNFGDIGEKMQNVIDDLYKDPSKMSEEQYSELVKDIKKMAKEMAENMSDIADKFNKSEEDTFNDIKKMRKTLLDAVDKMRNEKLTKSEKKDIANKVKDSLEDIIFNDVEKNRENKKRKTRDENISNEIAKESMQNHPLRKLINVFENLMNLCGDPYNLVCQESYDNMESIVEILENLTTKKLSEYDDDDVEDLKQLMSQLKDSLFIDLKELLNNKTILNKTENDMRKGLDDVFNYVNAVLFKDLINSNFDDKTKASLLKSAASKMRIIGKVLKTQKSWIASDEFKEGYREMRDDLLSLFKKDKKAVLKRLYNMGVLNSNNIANLDKRSKKLYDELVEDGEI